MRKYQLASIRKVGDQIASIGAALERAKKALEDRRKEERVAQDKRVAAEEYIAHLEESMDQVKAIQQEELMDGEEMLAMQTDLEYQQQLVQMRSSSSSSSSSSGNAVEGRSVGRFGLQRR